jgi:hypothetical protein
MRSVDIFGLPSVDWITSSITGLVAVACFFAAICLAFSVLAYILIARFEVVPRISLGWKGFRLRFERLPPSSRPAEGSDT